ncbi:hypothetical protein E3P91_04168 [Wallemia ichthyophaga]|nr:hypothetical protein E3P91_04168 [Wallemia ichthyophaga]TIB57550.1 hypothetical protein E3P78_04162 [Wallemia ichthyophaga]
MTKTVIVGGGIIGVCVAYYLSKEEGMDVTIVENTEVACGASGKAGGFLAKDWHATATESLGLLSFDLHKKLADEYNGQQRWQYRGLQSSNVLLKATNSTSDDVPKTNIVHDSEEPFRPRPAPKGESNIDWISKPSEDSSCIINQQLVSDGDTTAQLDPYLFTLSVLDEAVKNGVRVVKGSVMAYENNVVTLDDGEFIATDKLVLAAGPWTSNVFNHLFPKSPINLPIEALPGYSLVLRPTSLPSAHAVFTTILGSDSVGMSGTPEMFSRPDGTFYVAGENEGPDMPSSARTIGEVALEQEHNWDKLLAAVHQLGPFFADADVIKKQLCYRPITHRKRPIISSITGLIEKDVFVASGHGPWGISLAPGTGKVLSELIIHGKAISADIQSLSIENF